MRKRGEQEYSIEFAKILKRCSRGDVKAQEHLFRQYYGFAMSISLRFSSSRDNASEIVNDSFLKIFKTIEAQRVVDDFKPWVRKIVINTAIDYYRREKKRGLEISIDEASYISDNESVVDNLNAEDIIKLINSLPMIYRYTFTLYEIEGFSHDEIAHRLGISASTSRSNLSRAKRKLRQMIQTLYEHDEVV